MMRKIILISIFLFVSLNCIKEKPLLTLAIGGAPNEITYWEKIIKEFEDETNIKVNILRQPTDTEQRRQGLVIALKARKKDPDVFLMDVVWVAQFAASNWLLALDNYMKRDSFEKEIFFSSAINQVDNFNGEIIALPVYIDCGILYYRSDLLKKYGFLPPKTWDELLRCSQEIQKKERKNNENFFGFVWQGAQYEGLVCNFIEFISSNEGKIFDKKGNIVLNSPQNIKALQFMIDLIHKYKISPPNTYTEMKEEEVRTFFEGGNAIFERNWPYAWKLQEGKDSPVKGKVGVSILPTFREGKNSAALGGWHIGISRFSDQKEEAWKLVKFILSYETQKKLAINLGWYPGRKDIFEDKDVKKKIPHLDVLRKAIEHLVARPNVPYYTQISEILQRYINSAISGKMKSQEALQEAEKEIKKVIESYE